MNEKTIIKAVKKIFKNDNIQVKRIKNEEDSGYYNVWKVIIEDKAYIFKRSTELEIKAYKSIKSDSIPQYYGYISYYGKLYILIEYIEGQNLMKANRTNLTKVLDALINLQKPYFQSNETIGLSFEECKKKILARKAYLNDAYLEAKYSEFYNFVLKCDKTLTHYDLLPFNVIVGESKTVLIDLELIGVIPYPMALCRLIAHSKNEEDYLFYMSDSDKEYAINYYYENFIKDYNISFDDYIKTINYFMFYEYTEWVFVYNKYSLNKDDRFAYYYDKSLEYANKL